MASLESGVTKVTPVQAADTTARPASIPAWVTGTLECQVALSPGITIFKDRDKVILKLADVAPNGTETGSVVEFEVDPAALSESKELEVSSLKKYLPDLRGNHLANSLLLKSLCSQQDLFKIRRLHIWGDSVELEGTLTKGAVVSGRTNNSLLSFQGGPATFENLTIQGSSTVDLNCENATFKNVSIGSSSALSGNLSGLSLQGNNSVSAYAAGLSMRRVSTEVSASALRNAFKGAHISGKRVDLSLFQDSLRELSYKELSERHESLNTDFFSQHFEKLSPRANNTCDLPKLLAHAHLGDISAKPLADGKGVRIEFPIPVQTAAIRDKNEPRSTLVLEVPKPSFGSPSFAIYTSVQVAPTEGDAAHRISGDVPFEDCDQSSPLLHHWLWRALRKARGQDMTSAEFSCLVLTAQEKLHEVGEAKLV